MLGQGRYMSELQIKTIVRLLSSTEMSIEDIAKRIGCSKSAVMSVNRRFSVRRYAGSRAHWKLAQ